MRIISKDNDYYDSIQAYGQDQSLTYVREARNISFYDALTAMGVSFVRTERTESFSVPFMHYLGHEIPQGYISYRNYSDAYYTYNLIVRRLIVGFCGQWTPCLFVQERLPKDPLRRFVHCYYPGDEDRLPKLSRFFTDMDGFEKRREAWVKFLNIKLRQKDDLFHQLKSPILVADVSDWGRRGFDSNDTVITADASLSQISFYRCKDAFTTYQEVSQYLSGVLGVGTPKTVEIADIHRRDAKGFDGWSFKKRPE